MRKKAPKKHSLTKVKARNFLTNTAYRRINAADFKNQYFIQDCYSFISQYLNQLFY